MKGSVSPITVELADESATELLGTDIAAALGPGDLVALEGDLGAGKTTLARAIVRSICADRGLEVPSPTYTLVQSYEGLVGVAHFDLYRLGAADELEELGLEEALNEGIALVEWADRFADALPGHALEVHLAEHGTDGRLATLSGTDRTMERLLRSRRIRKFLGDAGWGAAWRQPLTGDASTRTYETILLENREPRLIMDAPAQPDGPVVKDGKPYSAIAHLAETVEPFVAIDGLLRERGYAAPEIHAADLDAGILLIEYLQGEPFLGAEGKPIADRYLAAAELLADMHERKWPRELEGPFGARHVIPDYDLPALMIEAELLLDWYMPAITGSIPGDRDRQAYSDAWHSIFSLLRQSEKTIVLRDFHSPNIIWQPSKAGYDRLGIIDFQDAVWGPAAYDVVSLAQDARVTISPELERAVIDTYCRHRRSDGFDETVFRRDYAVMSMQRLAKLFGIFVRLDRRDGKPAYLRHLPRVRDYARRTIDHDALAPMRALFDEWGLLAEELA